MGNEMVELLFSILLLFASSLETEGWKHFRTSGLDRIPPMYSKTLGMKQIGFSEQTHDLDQVKYLPYYNPFTDQDPSKIVPTNVDPSNIVENSEIPFVDPGAEIGYSLVIPQKITIFLNNLFNKHNRWRYVLGFLNKYQLIEISFLYAKVNNPNTLSVKQMQLLKILKQYSKQQPYINYDILGKDKEILIYLHELLKEFHEFYYGYPIDMDDDGGDKKPDKQININIWQFPWLLNYPQDFWLIVQKYPLIFMFDSPGRHKALMAIITKILDGLDISQLIGNTVEQRKYPPKLLGILLKLYGISSQQRIKIMYDFLSNIRNPEELMRYMYILLGLSQNKVPKFQPEFVMIPEEREKMIKNVIYYLLGNLNMAFLLNNPKEQEKYSPDLLRILFKVHSTGSKEQQYAILYDFLNNQNDPNILFRLISTLYKIIWNQPEKTDTIIEMPTEKPSPNDPFIIEDSSDSNIVIIKQIYDILKILDISTLFRNPIKQKSFPPELLQILIQIQNIEDETERYNALYALLSKKNNPTILMKYLNILFMYLKDTEIKPPEGNHIVYVPPLNSELIVKVINNLNNLGLIIDSNIQHKYPPELLSILLKLQKIGDKSQQFLILYEFLGNQKDPKILLEYLKLLLDLANNTPVEPDESFQPENGKTNIGDLIIKFINKPNITYDVINNLNEKNKYPSELINILLQINNIRDKERQFDILYGFLMKQNDLDLLLKYVFVLLDLSGDRNPSKDFFIEFPIEKQCSPDTMWKHDCIDCSCSNNGLLSCVIKQNCDPTPNEETVLMQCLPHSKFQLDGCSTCECNANGVPVCTLSECSSNIVNEKPLNKCKPYSKYQLDECNSCECSRDGVPVCEMTACSSKEKLDIALNVIINVNDDGFVCPSNKSVIPHCAPRTKWVDNCNECRCDSFGKRKCVPMLGCTLPPIGLRKKFIHVENTR